MIQTGEYWQTNAQQVLEALRDGAKATVLRRGWPRQKITCFLDFPDGSRRYIQHSALAPNSKHCFVEHWVGGRDVFYIKGPS